MSDSIIDKLSPTISDNVSKIDQGDEEVVIPEKCAYCKINVVCSVLPNFLALSRIGIFIEKFQCKYYGKSPPPKTAV